VIIAAAMLVFSCRRDFASYNARLPVFAAPPLLSSISRRLMLLIFHDFDVSISPPALMPRQSFFSPVMLARFYFR